MMNKILLIDDNPTDFQITKTFIEQMTNQQFFVIPEDYTVMGQAFSYDCKDITIWDYIPKFLKEHAEEICLIICDIKLNGSDDGLDLIRKIRDDRDFYIYPDHLFNMIVPIIAYTEHPDKETVAFKMGANYSFHKSVDSEERIKFIETIKQQIYIYQRTYGAWNEYMWPNSIKSKIAKFKQMNPGTNLFLMSSFQHSHQEYLDSFKEMLSEIGGFTYHMADAPGGEFTDELLQDVAVYMHGCDLGIAILFEDHGKQNVTSPSVCLEIGYMRALQKPILLFREETVPDEADFNGVSQSIFEKDQLCCEKTKRHLERWITNQLFSVINSRDWY